MLNWLLKENLDGIMPLKESIFMGLRRSNVSVHEITIDEGITIEFLVTVGSIPDNTTLQEMNMDLLKNGDSYGDAAYINQQQPDLLLTI